MLSHGASSRRGGALVEVLVASVLLATAGTVTLTWLAQSQSSIRAIHRAEREVIDTSEELDRMMILDRDSIIALVGWSQRNGWSVHVTRVADALFDVALSQSSGSPPLLSTTIYRPLTVDDH